MANPNPVQKSNIEIAREKILQIEKMLNSIVIGHEDFIRALLISAVAGEHMVVIGPPGTAKSYTIKIFAQLVNARFYQYLLTKFTSYDELFGTVDIISLSKGEYRRNWSKIVSSEFIFLDEIFKANSAILNALLSLLQERIVYDPMTGQPISTAVWSTIGASNEVPEDPELQALYDRFAIKIFIDYLSDDVAFLRAIESRWVNSNNSLTPIASMQDVKVLNEYAITLMRAKIKDLGEVYKTYHINVMPLLKNLRSRGVLVSDRTIIEKMPKIFASYLALYGVTIDNVMNAPYDLVKYLARSREELKEINKAIEDSLGEIAELARKLEKAKEYLKAKNLQGAKEHLKEILTYDISRLERTPWLKPRVEAIISIAKQYLNTIAQIEEHISKLSQI